MKKFYNGVSILILLEVPLQLEDFFKRLKLPDCFNPYFTGSTTSTSRWIWWRLRDKWFQSLFYWKYHFNQGIKRCKCNVIAVSILILLEVPLQQIFRSFALLVLSSFNPYFTGSTTSTYFLYHLYLMTKSFNPYFTGSTTST